MRIAYVVNCFMPELGYLEYYLAKKQQDMGHKVCVITSNKLVHSSNKHWVKKGRYTEEEIDVFRLSTVEVSPGIFLTSPKEFKKGLTDFSPDIVHIHGLHSPLTLMPIFYKRLGYKIVSNIISGKTIAESLELAVKKTFLKLYRMTIWPYILRRNDFFIAVSEASKDWLHKELHINPSRVHFIPLGADSDLFHFNSKERIRIRKALGLSTNDIVVIYTGKLLLHKRIELLFLASAPLIRANYGFKILIVGEGSDNYVNDLRILADRLGISHNVIFHDFVHRTMLPSFYSAADFAVWPAHHTISIIEAMSTGLPVVIPKSKWTNHLLKNENGFSYQEGEIAELRRCIRTLLNNVELRREMGRRGRELVKRELNWSNIAEEYLKIYTSVLETRN